jgi:hypothetical protein
MYICSYKAAMNIPVADGNQVADSIYTGNQIVDNSSSARPHKTQTIFEIVEIFMVPG